MNAKHLLKPHNRAELLASIGRTKYVREIFCATGFVFAAEIVMFRSNLRELIGYCFLFFALPLFALFLRKKEDATGKCNVFDFSALSSTTALREAVERFRNDQHLAHYLVPVTSMGMIGVFVRWVCIVYETGGIAWTMTLSAIVASLLPLTAIPLAKFAFKRLQNPGIKGRFIAEFLLLRYPSLSMYFGILLFCLSISFGAHGLGESFGGWIAAAVAGANLLDFANVESAGLQIANYAAAIIAAVLFGALNPIATRISAAYQVFVKRLVAHRDSIFDAILETAHVKATRIGIPQKHPQLWNFLDTGWYLVACYLIICSLLLFAPHPLSDAISTWINYSTYDAIGQDLSWHFNFQVFLASVIAAIGAVPFAIMSCVFLPNKRPRTLVVSQEGILFPHALGMIPGRSPLKYWSDLRTVTLIGASEPGKQSLRLSFQSGDRITLRTSKLETESLSALLAQADEYAPNCEFDPSVVALRTSLNDQLKTRAIDTDNKFASTIFTARRPGDYLKQSRYRVVRKLASKPLSAVYLARDYDNHHVVIKEFVLPTSVRDCDRMDETFNREYSILRSLKNDRIAQVIEAFEERGSRYIVMEHIKGADLRSIAQQRGGVREATAIRWAVEIAELMLFLHQQQPPVLHRDLTPDNLMEDENGQIKIIDFGAAHQFMEGVTGTLIGKQCYIAPEQLRGKPTVQSDIYSFGCTLHFLLTGIDPVALRSCDPQIASDSMRAIVGRCTSFDEEPRYRSFEAVLHDLRQLQENKTILSSTATKS